MTTASQAYAALRARLGDNKPAGLSALRWQNEQEDSEGVVPLPDVPAPFAFAEFNTRPAELVSFGAGAGGNRYRTFASFDIYVFVPTGAGLDLALTLSESCAALFRSYRTSAISCFDATVLPGGHGAELTPPGLASEAGNYFWAAAAVSLFFDQIG